MAVLKYRTSAGDWEALGGAAEGALLADGSVPMDSGAKLDFPSVVGDKIRLYPGADGTASSFGIGVESGTLVLHVPAANKVAFRAGGSTGSNGAEWAFVDANGVGPRSNINVTFMNNFTGQCGFRVTPAVVTLSVKGLARTADSYGFNEYQICALPAGVPAPWLTLAQGGSCYQGVSITAHFVIEVRPAGLWFKTQADNILSGDLDANVTITWAR